MDQNPSSQSSMPQPQSAPAAQTPNIEQVSQTPPLPENNNKKKVLIILCVFALALFLLGGIWFLFSLRTNSNVVSTSNYFSPQPSSTPSPTPSDLTEEEASMDASLKQLDSDQKSIDQSLNDQSYDLNSL
jgi:hypothetical protein